MKLTQGGKVGSSDDPMLGVWQRLIKKIAEQDVVLDSPDKDKGLKLDPPPKKDEVKIQ